MTCQYKSQNKSSLTIFGFCFTTTDPSQARVYLFTQRAAVQPRLTLLVTKDLEDKHQAQDYHEHLHLYEAVKAVKNPLHTLKKNIQMILIYKDNSSCLVAS